LGPRRKRTADLVDEDFKYVHNDIFNTELKGEQFISADLRLEKYEFWRWGSPKLETGSLTLDFGVAPTKR
jgi:hypothetical protein